MADIKEAIRRIAYMYTVEGADKVVATQEAIAASTTKTDKASLSLEKSFNSLERRYVETVRAQQDYQKVQERVNAAVAQNPALQERANVLLASAQARLSAVGKASDAAGQQIGLARHELINLGRQAQDVGVSLASGQSPLMVLAQQGSQIADVFIASGKSVGSFFSQAIAWARPFVTSTAGIITGIAAIGAAAVYAASQFLKASTTIEQALENQNRLLKEGKALIDARTSAEARAQLNPRDLTEFEIKRNLLDLQRKLNDEARGALIRTAPRPNIAGDIRGEFAGEAPLTPGMDKMIDAAVKLKAAQAAGLPGLKEFNAELGRIATAHPELAKTVDKMIELGRTGIELENAEMRLKAISDAMKGVATNAQLAAVGLGSIAQFKLSNLQAEQGKEATERQAQNVLLMAQAYPGMSIEVAKQLDTARGQLAIAQQTTGLGQINAQHQVTFNNLLLQGLSLSEAIAVADAQRATALAQVNAEAERTLKSLKNENELIHATSEADADRIRSRQTYNELIERGVSSERASAVAAQQLQNATDQRARATRQAADAAQAEYIALKNAAIEADNLLRAMLSFVPTIAVALGSTEQLFKTKSGGYSQFNPAGYTSTYDPGGLMASNVARAEQTYGSGGFTVEYIGSFPSFVPNESGLAYVEQQKNKAFESTVGLATRGGNFSGINDLIARGGIFTGGESDPTRLQAMTRAIDLLSPQDQTAPLQGIRGQLQGLPQTIQTAELIKQLNDKLEQLSKATDANTGATQSMTDVLSPFYSQDPRSTHLGFRAFAGGGIMTQHGMLPLRQYQGGGMATSPQVAVFGEGSTPEAYVPVPSGRIPVEIKQAANSNRRPINVTINVHGNADSGTVAALKSTAFQQAQAMRRVMG